MGGSIKILHLGKYYPPEPGGVEVVVKSFSEATAGKIFNYCLVASKRDSGIVEVSAGHVVHYLKERGTFLLTPVLPSLPFVLHRLLRRGGFDAVILHYPNPMTVLALFLSLLLRKKREKIAVWYHADVLLEERWKRVLYSLFRPVEESLFRRTDVFIAATPNHVSSSETFRRFRDRTCIVPYAIPDGWFEVSEAERRSAVESREKFGGRYLLFVGRLVPYKGLNVLLRAADRIRCRIVLVGTGPLGGALREEIAKRGLGEKVELLGKVDDLRPLYLGCDFLVLPSVSNLEGFGVVQIEAMALGKPVVSSDLPTGVTWVNRDGETGLTVPVGNDDAFADACNRLLDDGDLRNRLGDNARRRALEEFSYGAMARKAEGLVAALLRNGGAYGGIRRRRSCGSGRRP